jgi:hypothetical protein
MASPDDNGSEFARPFALPAFGLRTMRPEELSPIRRGVIGIRSFKQLVCALFLLAGGFVFCAWISDSDLFFISGRGAEAAENTVSDANVDVYLHHYGADDKDSPLVHLRIPADLTNGTPGSAYQMFGINLLIWYPRMTGARDPRNSRFLNCVGDCGGQMLLTLGNRIGESSHPEHLYEVLLNQISESRRDKDSPIVYEITQSEGFDEVITRRNTYPAVAKTDLRETKYYIHRAAGKIEFVAECYELAPVPRCSIETTFEKFPGIAISLDFVRERLPEWKSIKTAIDSFVSSMFVGIERLNK